MALTVSHPAAYGGLFQHLDASVAGSVVEGGETLVWIDQSGNGRHAFETSAGSGSVSFSMDEAVFPTGLPSLRFEGTNFANYGRLQLFSSSTSDAVLDQSGPGASGFSVFVVVRGDAATPVQDWNDLIGNTTEVGEGAFLMRYNAGAGLFQGAVGGLTVQNNYQGQNNYSGAPTVLAFNYNPAQPNGEISLASSLNGYHQVFNLSDQVSDRDFSNNDPFTLGKAYDTIGRLFVGNVGEVKVYDAALTTHQFTEEIGSLDRKWNTSPDGRLDLVIDRATGVATFSTPGSVGVDLVGLRLRSRSGSLDPSDWLSITDHYDSNSGGFFDVDDAWLELSDTAGDLSEATFGTSSVLPGQSLSLGSVFKLGGVEDVEAEYADPATEEARPVFVRYVNSAPADLLPGDFNDDGAVDAGDYTAWRDNVGATTTLPNEVVSNGRVTPEDYQTWRDAYGSSSASLAAEVPEPGAAPLFLLSALVAACVTSVRAGVQRAACVAILALAGLAPVGEAEAVEATVGVYYYPWWDTHDWGDSLRANMLPEDHPPLAGYTASSDADLIADHINQSHRGNISLWATSWWGPGTIEDVVLQQHIFTHPRASELKYAVHYESTGRFNGFDSPDFSNLTSDFEYLAENVFTNPNYFRIDGRPVVFMYVSRAYFNNPEAHQALADARQTLVTNYGYDPYVVGDEIFDSGFNATRAQSFDAVTTYDVYAMSGLSEGGVTQGDIQRAASKYAAGATAGATVIPAVTPGYNDKAVRDGHNVTGRYFSGETIEQAGSVFSALIDDAAGPNLDASTGNLMMVNSFNEWHEDTQIEPSVVVAPSAIDNTPTGTEFTQGVTFEGYGYKYLDLLRTHTTEGGALLIDGDADFDGDLDIDDVAAFVQAWGAEHLVDEVRVGGYASRTSLPDFNYDGVVDFEDWFYVRANVPGAASVDLQALIQAPEPGALAVAGLLWAVVLATRARVGSAYRHGPTPPYPGEEMQ